MPFLWGKLFNIPFYNKRVDTILNFQYNVCIDSAIVMALWKKAERVGVYPEALYKYYQYHNSLSRTNVEGNVKSYGALWERTKKFIEFYGPVSKINEDFLYAIHLSLVDEAVENVFTAELATDIKLDLFQQIFSDPVWPETMARDADPQFQNLAARKEYVNGVKNKILALPGVNEYSELKENVFQCLEGATL
jgi:hypothetical protein